MKPLEVNVFKRLRERVTRPEDRFERVENGLGEGWPDVNYCMVGTEGWIEIKAPEEPVRAETPLFGSNHPVSMAQINWMHSQHQAGGLSWLFIGTRRRLMLVNGSQVAALGRRINELTVAQTERITVWRTLLPVANPETWMNLRELLATPQR